MRERSPFSSEASVSMEGAATKSCIASDKVASTEAPLSGQAASSRLWRAPKAFVRGKESIRFICGGLSLSHPSIAIPRISAHCCSWVVIQ